MVKVSVTADRRKREKLAQASGSSAVAPTYRSSFIGYTGSGNVDQNVTLPVGAVAGDLLLLWGVGPGIVTKTANGGQTWTQVLTSGASGASYSVWWCIFTGALGTTTLHLSTAGSTWSAGLVCISGHNAATPMDASPTSVSAGATTGVQTVPAITTVTDGALRIILYSVQASNGISSCMTGMPATQSIKYNQIDQWIGNAKCDALGTAVQSPAATSPVETFTQVIGAGTRAIAHIAVRPA